MEPSQIKEIRGWLESHRNYRQGVLLYHKYGHNLMLKRRFAVDRRPETEKLLIDELCRLAGVDNTYTSARPDTAKSGNEVAHEAHATAEIIPATEAQTKSISLRKRFEFLGRDDCPDILKVLVADMLTHYGRYMEARKHLAEIEEPYSEEAAQLSEELVENYLANREIWDELEYYRDNGVVLGKAEKFKHIEQTEQLGTLTDEELLRKLQSARAQYSKHKKRIDGRNLADDDPELAKAQSWLEKKQIYEAEIERRKKK